MSTDRIPTLEESEARIARALGLAEADGRPVASDLSLDTVRELVGAALLTKHPRDAPVVVDFFDGSVVYRLGGGDDAPLFRRSYAVKGGKVTLGDPAKVVATQTYTTAEAERRIAAALSDIYPDQPKPPGLGERVTQRVTARLGDDEIVADIIERDEPAPVYEPGSIQESEARIAAAIAGAPIGPARRPGERVERQPSRADLADDAAFHRTLAEAKRHLAAAEAHFGRAQGGGGRRAGAPADLREPGRILR